MDGAGQSSYDKWKRSKPQDKWKEISLEMIMLDSVLQEKTSLSNEINNSRALT